MAGSDDRADAASGRLPMGPEGRYLHPFMLTPADMARRVLEELGDAATVHVSPALRASLSVPSTVELVTDLDAPVDLALVAALRVGTDGSLQGDPVPPHARRVVAVITAPDRGALVRGPAMAEAAASSPPTARVLTPLAVLDLGPDGFRVREVAGGVSAADVQRWAEPRLLAGPDLAVIGSPADPTD